MAEKNMGEILVLLGLYMLLLIFVLIFVKKGKKQTNGRIFDEVTDFFLANRNVGKYLGCLTMAASWIGGLFVNGAADVVYATNGGLIWSQATWCYMLSLIVGGIFFARKMREANYVTLLDPLQISYGKVMSVFLYVPALLCDLCWAAASLSLLSGTITGILGLDIICSYVISTSIVIGYTFVGGMHAIVYTDAVQVIFAFFGLWLAACFVLTNDDVRGITGTSTGWTGTLKSQEFWKWIDLAMTLIFGSITWQTYFQRVLASKTKRIAQRISFAGCFCGLLVVAPTVLIGAAVKSIDWSQATVESNLHFANETRFQLVLDHLVPNWVSFIGVVTASAVTMTSANSSILSASSIFAYNVYKKILRPKSSPPEIIWVARISICVFGILAGSIGFTFQNTATLNLSKDLVYVIVFPQLVGALYFPFVNTYGSIAAYVVGLLRLCGGEKSLGFEPWVQHPFYNNGDQYFPFCTFSMGISFVFLLWVSWLFNYIQQTDLIPKQRNVSARKEWISSDQAILEDEVVV